MLGLSELRVRRDTVAESSEIRYAARFDELSVPLATVLLIGLVGDAEDVQTALADFGGVRLLEALLDVVVSGIDEEELQSEDSYQRLVKIRWTFQKLVAA